MLGLLAIACGNDDAPTSGGIGGDTTAGEQTTTRSETTEASGPATADASTTASTGAPDHGALASLEIAPTERVLAVDLGVAATQAFTVHGRYEDGAVVDLTDAASFVLEDPELGTMDGATLVLPAFRETHAAIARVTATVEGEAAQARLVVVAHPRSGDEAQALLVLPYQSTEEDPAGPPVQSLALDTAFDRLDVIVNVDATGSMGGPIAVLQATLAGSVIPSLRAAVADAWVGVAAFMDYPIAPFGTPGCDQPFVLLHAVGPSAAEAQAAALELTDGPFGGPIGCGGDAPASHLEALWQLATGEGLGGPAPTFVAPSDAGLRDGALPVIVSITGARSHDPAGSACGGIDYDADPAVLAVAAGRAETEAALAGLCARVVTMAVSGFDPTCSPLADGVALAEATGALVRPAAWDVAPGGRPAGCAEAQCCTGLDGAGVAPVSGQCPLVQQIPFGGTGLDARMAETVSLLVRHVPVTVTATVHGTTASLAGTPLPAGLDTAAFIASLTPQSAGPSPVPGLPDPLVTPTAFLGVAPGTPVAFELVGHNEIVPPTDAPQLFTATITARADGCVVLDDREVLVLVPPSAD